MTEKHKLALKEGRKKAKFEEKIKEVKASVTSETLINKMPKYPETKPVLVVTGKEKNGFDFWKSMRQTLRPMHFYALCKEIEKEIVSNTMMWQNIDYIKGLLERYFILQQGPLKKIKKIKKERKKGNRKPLTEEHKLAMQLGRVKKSELTKLEEKI